MNKSDNHLIISSFLPISLKDMDGVSLMNRVESKYVFSTVRLPDLLNQLSEKYKVLEIGSIRTFPYHTTYLDTSDYMFYNQQLIGKLNRHKIRYRIYESTGCSFLEIKKKTNKNRTIKWRIENSLNIDSPNAVATAFINEYLPITVPDLRPVLINTFKRITLVRQESGERVTLDYDLTFGSPDGNDSGFPFLAIAEVKCERHSGQSAIGIAMKKMGIRSNSFSKYCIGSALIREMPRKNVLKPKLLLIKKIENEYIKLS